MKKIFLFMMVTLDGYIEGPDHDISWHNVDKEFNTFAARQLQEADTILFGRKTYELMESYWPTAKPSDPDDAEVATFMNTTPKVVVSKTLKSVKEKRNWKNITCISKNTPEELARLKVGTGKNIIVLGSNNLCVTLLELGLLDELRIMVNPVVIGTGTTLFQGISQKINLQLLSTKKFKNGNILLSYQPR